MSEGLSLQMCEYVPRLGSEIRYYYIHMIKMWWPMVFIIEEFRHCTLF